MTLATQKSQRGYNADGFHRHFLSFALCLLIGAIVLPSSHCFCSTGLTSPTPSQLKFTRPNESIVRASVSRNDDESERNDILHSNCPAPQSRRAILSRTITVASSWWCLTSMPLGAFASAEDDVKETRALIEKAKSQLESVPSLLKEEKWDGVRQVLMEAPLRDCWSKSTPVLKKYAEALGETPKGDELAALEGREDLLQHLRFLDMAVYNNVFNPIATEGTTGASKALIDSYYNDPTREFDASMKAINGLLELSN